MTFEERETLLGLAKELKEQYFPLPSEEEAKKQDEFIRKVCYATWSSIGHSAKNNIINSGLTFCKERDFEQEWMKHGEALCAYVEHQARDNYEKAMKDAWGRRFKFNGKITGIIFHSDLSLTEAMREIVNTANEVKEME